MERHIKLCAIYSFICASLMISCTVADFLDLMKMGFTGKWIVMDYYRCGLLTLIATFTIFAAIEFVMASQPRLSGARNR